MRLKLCAGPAAVVDTRSSKLNPFPPTGQSSNLPKKARGVASDPHPQVVAISPPTTPLSGLPISASFAGNIITVSLPLSGI
jgi:hypothetical protein